MPKVEVNGINLHYEETGSGTPLIFVPGLAGDHYRCESQLRFFGRRYRTIAYAARGYPPSDVPDDPSAYTLEAVLADARGLMDALGIDRAHVCGLSTGSSIALSFLLKHPERVISFAYVSGGHGSGKHRETWLPTVEANADAFAREGMNGETARRYVDNLVQLKRKDPRSYAEFRERFLGYSTVGFVNTSRGASKERPDVVKIEDALKKITHPVFILTGDEDYPTHEASLFMKKCIPRAGMEMLPRTGHLLNLEEPDRFNRSLLDFLTAVDNGAWFPVSGP